MKEAQMRARLLPITLLMTDQPLHGKSLRHTSTTALFNLNLKSQRYLATAQGKHNALIDATVFHTLDALLERSPPTTCK
jgi:hypothetical protein